MSQVTIPVTVIAVLRDNPPEGESPFQWLEIPKAIYDVLPDGSSFMTLNEMRKKDGHDPVEHPDADGMSHFKMLAKWWAHEKHRRNIL